MTNSIHPLPLATIKNIVAYHLSDASIDYCREVVSHGIHNLTNKFSDGCEEDYYNFQEEFYNQASAAIEDQSINDSYDNFLDDLFSDADGY